LSFSAFFFFFFFFFSFFSSFLLLLLLLLLHHLARCFCHGRERNKETKKETDRKTEQKSTEPSREQRSMPTPIGRAQIDPRSRPVTSHITSQVGRGLASFG